MWSWLTKLTLMIKCAHFIVTFNLNFISAPWITMSWLLFPFSEMFLQTSPRCHCKCWKQVLKDRNLFKVGVPLSSFVVPDVLLYDFNNYFVILFWFRVHNRISELLMHQLEPFVSLETLDLTSNSISDLKAGSFPMMQLKYL